MVLRANEVKQWMDNQKTLLQREHDEKCTMKAAKKRLLAIQKEIKKNNELLRRN